MLRSCNAAYWKLGLSARSSRLSQTSRLTSIARPFQFRVSLSQYPSYASGVEVAVYFLDTSAVVKRYLQENGTTWIENLAAPTAGHSLFLVRIALAETVAAMTR